mmetsp:Transcript_9617/g.24243  ORF Transcript_9617/g.24243 Transcript_9617/m.24243 type:complete len:331 (-) Transcript_9617:981-1973(-)
MMFAVVPAGVASGDRLNVVTPDGQFVTAKVPPGVSAGQRFQVNYSPAQAVGVPLTAMQLTADLRLVNTDKGAAIYVAPQLRTKKDKLPRMLRCGVLAVETPPPFGRQPQPFIRYFLVTAPIGVTSGDRLLFEFEVAGAARCSARGKASLIVPADVPSVSAGHLFVAPVDARKNGAAGKAWRSPVFFIGSTFIGIGLAVLLSLVLRKDIDAKLADLAAGGAFAFCFIAGYYGMKRLRLKPYGRVGANKAISSAKYKSVLAPASKQNSGAAQNSTPTGAVYAGACAMYYPIGAGCAGGGCSGGGCGMGGGCGFGGFGGGDGGGDGGGGGDSG